MTLSAPAGEGLAIRCAKVLTMNDQDAVHAPGMIWIEDGELTHVGDAGDG